jgi:cephalosporin hydroxylase
MNKVTMDWILQSAKDKYTYNFSWMGRPIIQFPQDMLAVQELIWKQKPDVILETGIAHGGSLIYYASLLELVNPDGFVVGVDIEIRPHNRTEIEAHPMIKRIKMVEGSSVSEDTAKKVMDLVKPKKKVMLLLDSNHTHDHVLKELDLYSPLVQKGSSVVVFDTIIEDMPKGSFPDRPWDKGNNPKTAVWAFLKKNNRFRINKELEEKIQITVAPDGYLDCIEDA